MVRLMSIVCAWVLGLASLAWPAVEYQLIDLGPTSAASAISAEGVVVGGIAAVEPPESAGYASAAVLWPALTVIRPESPTGEAHATGVAGDEVVGAASFGPTASSRQGFTWNPRDGLRYLGTLGGASVFSYATGVNQALTTSGWTDASDGSFALRPVAWVAGVIQDLGTLGGASATALAMNAAGDIVGESDTATREVHATLWPLEGGIMDLDTTAGPFRHSVANAMNASRTVVGQARFGDQSHGFAWTATGGMQDLGALAGDNVSSAHGVSDRGVIVGISVLDRPGVATSRAVRWRHGVLVDLNTLVAAPGLVLEEATDINTTGIIVANGRLNGQWHGWMLLPVVPVVPTPPAKLVVQVHGDFDADTWQDLAGLAADSTIYRCLAGDAACTQLPGNAIGLAAVDITGDGRDDLVAVSADTALWAMTDGATWHRVPGYLAEVASSHFYGGQRVLVGLDWGGQLWTSADAQSWVALPYYLEHIAAGDFRGNGWHAIAATDFQTTLWLIDSVAQWSVLPGNLVTVEALPGTPAGLRGVAADGVVWVAHTLGAWQRE